MKRILFFSFIMVFAIFAFAANQNNTELKTCSKSSIEKPHRIQVTLENKHTLSIVVFAGNKHVLAPGEKLELSLKPNTAIQYRIMADENENDITGPNAVAEFKTISKKTDKEFSRSIVFHPMKDKTERDIYVEEYILSK